ncbi:MAG: response regulator [Acidobacteriota bacterium]|nr:response regulator [Acidobacteriota bacterium]MDE3170872.1 response regulator [Acidobacteriota bacterium]
MACDAGFQMPVYELLASPPRNRENLPPARSRAKSRIPLKNQAAAEEAFNAVFDSSAEALLIIDRAGAIQRANARARELLGLPKASGRSGMPKIHFHADRDELSKLWKQPGAPLPRIVDAHLESGVPLRVALRAKLPGSEGLLLCAEDAFAVQPARQSNMLQTEKMAALGQLVSGIAHELNNPLTAIMGYTQLLLGRRLRPDHLSEAERVYQEAERARRIVKNLLYFARQSRSERTRVDLNEVVERTLALRSYELRVEDIVVQCELAPGLPATLADPYQLQQVVLNLLVNAEQAILESRGHGHVWIRTRHVADRAGAAARGRIVLEVSDDGPGIPPEIASRIFDPFFTSKPLGAGTGLGLSILYGIVQQHHGEVTFENQPASGARFVVTLPVMEAPGAPAAESREPAAASGAPEGSEIKSPARILVIEDERTVAQLIADVLREDRHRVEAVLDSQEGLRRLSRNQYDLVICDLRMPRIDGQAIYNSLRRAGSPLLDRMLFVTGDLLSPQTRAFLEPNALPYLAKPFLVEELKLAANQLLERRRPEKTEPTTAFSGAEGETAIVKRTRAGGRNTRR